MSQSQAEQLARELAREAAFLSERWGLWLINQVAEEIAAFDSEKQRQIILNQRMREAVEALQRVAQHLRLSEGEALTNLTMSRFDAAPASVRQDWKARQIADLLRGSWGVARAVAFTDGILPTKVEHERKRDKRLARKRREGGFIFGGIQQWLESGPKDKRRATYDRWAAEQNQLLADGQKAFLSAKGIQRRWRFSWPEIVQAVEEKRLPGEEEAASEVGDSAPPSDPSEEVNLDLRLNCERLRSAREAKGLEIKQLAALTGLEQSNLGNIERGENANPSFQTVAKLAAVLGLSLDELITDDSEE